MLHHLQNGKLITHPQITLASTIRNLFVGVVVATAVTVVVPLLKGICKQCEANYIAGKITKYETEWGSVKGGDRERERVLQLNASMHTDTHHRICSIYMHRNTM